MGARTGIAWCHHTFSPWLGCARVSPGCLFCYAEACAGSRWETLPRYIQRDAYWLNPLAWNRAAATARERRRVFPSVCDPFEGLDVSAVTARGKQTTLAEAWPRFCDVIRQTPWLDWLLLTKRPEHIAGMLPADLIGAPNVWVMTSIESPKYLDRAEALVMVPAVVHGLSLEPLLDEFTAAHMAHLLSLGITWVIGGGESKIRLKALRPEIQQAIETRSLVAWDNTAKRWVPKPHARAWARTMRDSCQAAGVAFFWKQWGGPRPYSGGNALDGQTWEQVPR